MTTTPQDKAIQKVRARNLTAAKRSLKLIADVAAQHAGLLEAGTVPEASFLVHAQKYEQARAALELLDMISTAKASEDDGLIEVHASDLDGLIEVFRAYELVGWPPADDSPLARLAAAVEIEWPEPGQRSSNDAPPWNEGYAAPPSEPDPGWPPQSSEDM